jgi:hypothetical protein
MLSARNSYLANSDWGNAMKKTVCGAIAATALLLAVSPSFASTVTYDLTATLAGGGTLTGTFTVNGSTLTAFDFTLPSGLPDPSAIPDH